MAHFAFISSPVPGHLNPASSLAQGLNKLGNQTTFINIPDAENFIRSRNLNYSVIGENNFPKGSWHSNWGPASKSADILSTSKTLNVHYKLAETMLSFVPDRIKELKIDALVADHLQFEGSSIAEKMNLPFYTLCPTLPLYSDPEGKYPPPFTDWMYGESIFTRLRNKAAYPIVKFIMKPYLKIINRKRQEWGLDLLKDLSETFSNRIQLSVIPEEFDFPREFLPKNYITIGPLIQESFLGNSISDISRPIIYVSMGTIRNQLPQFFSTLLESLSHLTDYQIILGRGAWNGNPVSIPEFKNLTILDYAPQSAILEKAVLCINHGGANTVLESCAAGVPCLLFPFGEDQYAMAIRMQHKGCGLILNPKSISSRIIQNKVLHLLKEKSYAQNAKSLQEKFTKYKEASHRGAEKILEDFQKRK